MFAEFLLWILEKNPLLHQSFGSNLPKAVVIVSLTAAPLFKYDAFCIEMLLECLNALGLWVILESVALTVTVDTSNIYECVAQDNLSENCKTVHLTYCIHLLYTFNIKNTQFTKIHCSLWFLLHFCTLANLNCMFVRSGRLVSVQEGTFTHL